MATLWKITCSPQTHTQIKPELTFAYAVNFSGDWIEARASWNLIWIEWCVHERRIDKSYSQSTEEYPTIGQDWARYKQNIYYMEKRNGIEPMINFRITASAQSTTENNNNNELLINQPTKENENPATANTTIDRQFAFDSCGF